MSLGQQMAWHWQHGPLMLNTSSSWAFCTTNAGIHRLHLHQHATAEPTLKPQVSSGMCRWRWRCRWRWAWSTHATVSASQEQKLSGRGARVYTCTCVHDNRPCRRLPNSPIGESGTLDSYFREVNYDQQRRLGQYNTVAEEYEINKLECRQITCNFPTWRSRDHQAGDWHVGRLTFGVMQSQCS